MKWMLILLLILILAQTSVYQKACDKNAESNNPVIDITVVTRYREILDYCACIPDCHAVLSPDSEKRHILHHKSRNYGGAGAEKDWYAGLLHVCSS